MVKKIKEKILKAQKKAYIKRKLKTHIEWKQTKFLNLEYIGR